MAKAKLFRNGRSQAVRLPKEFSFLGEEVFVWIDGHRSPSWGNSYPLVAYRNAYGD